MFKKTIFETNIKDKKCKHDWKVLNFKTKSSQMFESINMEYDYLYCPKCDSVSGDKITL